MKKGSFLLTRPDHEPTVRYLFAWAEKILEKNKKNNIFTVDLLGNRANKKQFTSSVKKFKPSFIFLNGHGSQNSVTGFDNKPLLSFAANEETTKNSVVYALSCQSAKRLGKSCVASGALAYLGYDDDFVFVFDEENKANFSQDKTAAWFLDPSNELVEKLLAGKTSAEAFQSSQKVFEQTIIKFSLSTATSEERELLPYLLWDKKHQVCLGNGQAKSNFISEKEFKNKEKIKFFLLIVGLVLLLFFWCWFWFGFRG